MDRTAGEYVTWMLYVAIHTYEYIRALPVRVRVRYSMAIRKEGEEKRRREERGFLSENRICPLRPPPPLRISLRPLCLIDTCLLYLAMHGGREECSLHAYYVQRLLKDHLHSRSNRFPYNAL